VLAIDSLVRDCNIPNSDLWNEEVLNKWLINKDGPEMFLEYTNKFLCECFDSTQVLEDAIASNSYVAFLVIDRLSRLMLQLYVEWCKDFHPQSEVLDLLQGFVLFMSSDGLCIWQDKKHMPSPEYQAVVVEGLWHLENIPIESLCTMYTLQPVFGGKMQVEPSDVIMDTEMQIDQAGAAVPHAVNCMSLVPSCIIV
jgi:hypothetical protein